MNQINDLDKLSMLDSKGHKMSIIPAEVHGRFRNYRNLTEIILVLFFLILPWTKINEAQSILIDIPNRKFAIFGLVFFAHDGPLLFFIFLILSVGLATATALFGRAWCGWACPQTVFIDGLFRRIELFVEGTYMQRRKLEVAPMSLNKAFRKLVKWFLFIVASSILAHSFLAYFVGSEELIKMIQTDPRLNLSPFLIVSITTAILAFNFGWFREQFCIIVCPYGRFQSVLQDNNSVTVTYDSGRGEPRRNSPDFGTKKGDCVACKRCVQVCPTGIDIRNGAQMECIACTACIDACDDMMTKLNKPIGLIRYSSLNGQPAQFFRPRVLAYCTLILFGIIGLSYNVINRSPLEVFILRGKEAPYSLTVANDGQPILLNHMRLHLKNQTLNDMDFKIAEPQEWAAQGLHLTMPESDVHLKPGDFKMLHFFVSSPKELVKGSGEFKTNLSVNGVVKKFTIVGPAN